jgi:hypothetical protein
MGINTATVRRFIITGLFVRDPLKTILIIIIVATAGIAGNPTPAYAEPVCIAIIAEVELVDDPGDYLEGAIEVGDIITGTYDYDSSTPDTNPLATVGDYIHTVAPFGITINAGDFVFRTDPNDVYFLVEIVNDHGNPPSDNYLLRSYRNIFDKSVPYETENYVSWQLDDPTLEALSSEALPTLPPVLADWQSIFGLAISSRNDDYEEFLVRAHVNSAYLCNDPPVQEVAICHKPGTPAQKTLFIVEQALEGHLRHGDALGECP